MPTFNQYLSLVENETLTKHICTVNNRISYIFPDDEPYQLNTPVRVVANTVSSDSILVSWYDRALGAEQRPRDNQYYTIRYYSYGLGQYEYMNVTDLSAMVTGLRPDTEYEFNVRANSQPYLSQWSENTRNRTTDVG